MIEAYVFIAAFAVQVLVVSIVNPSKLIRYTRGWAANFASDRFAQQFPGLDYNRSIERFVSGYRAANIVIALVGLVLLGWLFRLTVQPGWANDVTNLTVFYFLLQVSPLALVAVYTFARYRKFLYPPPEAKRKAVLQPRGLFDFVSPRVLTFAIANYLLFIPFAIYVDLYVYDNASLSKYCYTAILSVTLVYALNAFVIYKRLYGRANPLVNHEGRVLGMSASVKGGVYSCIAAVWFFVIVSFFTKLEMQNWKPFVLTVFMVICAWISFMEMGAPMRKTEAAGTSP